MAGIKAVIFDYKALSIERSEIRSAMADATSRLRAQGLRICVFSTNESDRANQIDQWGLTPSDCWITQKDVAGGKNRGSPEWISAAAERLAVKSHEFLYIGTTALDWRTAINAGVMYAHAGWARPQPARTTSIVLSQPNSVISFVDLFLRYGPSWTYSLSDKRGQLEVRALLPASAELPSTPSAAFTLQDIFTYERNPTVGIQEIHSARNLLMMHVITSCYQEGLLSPGSHFCVYPSSTVGRVSAPLSEYVRPASTLVHGFYREDLLERYAQSTDTSLERYRARREGRSANVSILDQANSVRIADRYAHGKLRDRTVVVFDDFMTEGTSLSWAQLLLSAAQASRVVLVSIGKYGGEWFTRQIGLIPINPFASQSYSITDFRAESRNLSIDASALRRLQESFALLAAQ